MSNHSHFPVDHEVEPQPNQGGEPKPTGFWSSRTGLVTIAFLAIGAFFLVSEHRAHVVPWLPWLILLACPLLHFGHGGHGGHGDAENNQSDNRPNSPHQH